MGPRISLLAVLSLAGHSLSATAAGEESPAVELHEIIVTATRTERKADETPGTVTAVDLREFNGGGLGDLVKGETLVSVPFSFSGSSTAYGRSGSAGFNIRGIEGNRVLLQVDGVRVPDEFRLGGSEPMGRDYFDPELYRRLEILQGSASALYGSDALGGVVTFTTKSPEDYNLSSDRPVAFGARLGYRSVDESWHAAGSVAAATGPLQALVVYSRHEGEEAENNGSVAPNPEKYASDAVLAKLVWQPAPAHRVEFAFEFFDRGMDIQADNRETASATSATTENSVTSTTERFRLSAGWAFTPGEGNHPLFDSLHAQIHWQDAVARDVAREIIAYNPPTAANGSFRDRLITTAFNNDTTGLTVSAVKRINAVHRFAYGVDASRTDTNKPWNSVVVNSHGTTYPSEPRMAGTETTRAGLYLQDEAEWTLAGGRKLVVIPGVRVDKFELTPDNSPSYLAITAGQPAPSFDETAVTPKLGVVLGLTPTFNAYAQYNRGFRYPAAEDLTATFTNPTARYRTIPNPNLREETSDAYEVGLKGRPFTGLTVRAAAFYTTYDDFIEQIASAPAALQDPVNWPSGTFQTQNRSDARIYGGELWARLAFGELSADLAGFSITASVGHSKGTFAAAGGARQRLTSVEPLKAVFTFGYDAPSGRFGGSLSAESAQGGRPGAATQFYAPSYTVLDLGAYWRVHERLTLSLGLNNLTDEKYWRYGSVRGVTTANVVEQERRSQPGINAFASASLRY